MRKLFWLPIYAAIVAMFGPPAQEGAHLIAISERSPWSWLRYVPWITIMLTLVFMLSPLGQDLYYSAFLSGEQLSNSIAQFMVTIILAIVVALAALECGIKFWLRRRRAKTMAS